MNKIVVALLITFLLQSPACAAEKIRIGFPDLAAQFIPLPLGQKGGFFEEEGLQGEFIRMVPTVGVAALASATIELNSPSIKSQPILTVRLLSVSWQSQSKVNQETFCL